MSYYDEMRIYYNHVIGNFSYSTRKKYLEKCHDMVKMYPDLAELYIFNDRAPQLKNRVKFVFNGQVHNVAQTMFNDIDEEERVYDINCLTIDPYKEAFPGLYFVGDIKYDPHYGKIFLVKCGGSNDVGERMKQYATHNPMFFHDYTSLPCDNWRVKEKIVQMFLKNIAIGRPPVSREWFIVSEENYFQLCQLFKDKNFFSCVAEGHWA